MHAYHFADNIENQIISLDEIVAISNALKANRFETQKVAKKSTFRDKQLAQKIAKLDEVLAKIG